MIHISRAPFDQRLGECIACIDTYAVRAVAGILCQFNRLFSSTAYSGDL